MSGIDEKRADLMERVAALAFGFAGPKDGVTKHGENVISAIDALIDAVRADEREACAKAVAAFSAWRCAQVIRKRGAK